MTNILTWDIKPIHLPKINSNLLSVVSLILLCTMAFLTIAVIADDCEDLKKAADEAKEDWRRATGRYMLAVATATAACAGARKTKNGYVRIACVVALGAVALAAWDMADKADDYLDAARAYLDCLKKNKGDDDNNGNNSSTTS